MTILIFLLVLTVLVLVHEFGHFFVAKKFKIKVEEFGFGLPPRIIGKKIGETIYSLNWLPIGGFVKLYGEDEAGAGRISHKIRQITNTSRAFYVRPAWQRALVIVAGVFMNFLLSVVIISFIFTVNGATVPGDKVFIDQVLKNSPAQAAGLATGDRIEFINGIKITSTSQLISETRKNLGREITLKVISGQNEREIKITPRKDYPKDQGPLGVLVSQNLEVKKYTWYQVPFAAVMESLKTSWLIIMGFGTLISQIVTTGAVPGEVAGPVGIAQLTGQVAKIGPLAVLSLVSLLSLNLAILNILPVPALDGGRLFFILIELITRKKVHPRFESYAHTIGMALLLALIALITFHDISRVLTGQSLLPR